jgi:hypothetical protein
MRMPFGVVVEDKTAIELFLAGIRGWEAGLRRLFENSNSKSGGYLLAESFRKPDDSPKV